MRTPLSVETAEPGIVMLAFDGEACADDAVWDEALDVLSDPAVVAGVVVLRGTRDRGAELARLRALGTRAEAREAAMRGLRTTERLRRLGKPVAAIVSGALGGAGAERALSCGAIFASAGHGTSLAIDAARHGLVPHLGGLLRLAERAGPESALALAIEGAPIAPQELVRDRIAAAALADADLEAAAIAWARERARAGPAPRRSEATRPPLHHRPLFRRRARAKVAHLQRDRIAARRIAEILVAWVERGEDPARELMLDAFAELAVSSTARCGLDLYAALSAREHTRALLATSSPPLRRVAVLGGSDAALQLAAAAARGGLEVLLVPPRGPGPMEMLARLTRVVNARTVEQRWSWIERNDALGRIRVTPPDAALPSPDLVIDVSDRGPASGARDATNPFDGMPRLVASSPSGDRAAGVGATPFALPLPLPASHEGAILEILGALPAPPTASLFARFAGAMGATLVFATGKSGSFVRRIGAAYVLEGLRLADESIPREAVDAAMLDWGFRIGPFGLLDRWGLASFASETEELARMAGERFATPPPHEPTTKGSRDRAAEVLAQPKRPEPRSRAPRLEEIQMRVALRFVAEAALALDDEALADEADADVAAVLGAGFPALRGGPMRYAITLGPREILRRLEGFASRFGARYAPARSLHRLLGR